MKKIYRIYRIVAMLFLALVLVQTTGFAQEEEATPEAPPKDRPSRPAFESGVLFDVQSTTIPTKKTLEMVISHRFGTADAGISELYGIWSPSNIRLGLNFSLLDNLLIGVGTTKFKKIQDLQIKYNVIQQTRSGKIPVTVSLYGNMGIDGRADNIFGLKYKFANRLSFFSQIIVSRRINDMFSIQIASSFTHYNMVDPLYEHDKIGISMYGRLKFSPQTSFIAGTDIPLKIKGIAEYSEFTNPPKPNFSAGFEISTSTHAFHIYFAGAQGILQQENMMWNHNEFFRGKYLVGLNITRLWGF